MSDTYTAANIRILEPQEVVERFDWAKVGALAAQYHQPAEFVARGLEACTASGVQLDYFVGRYLRWDRSIPRNLDFEAAYQEVVQQERAGNPSTAPTGRG
jgi:hypothetical protein